MTSCVVFNLFPYSNSLYLPSAFIVECDPAGMLGYPLQRATLATIGAHGVEPGALLCRMLDTIETLVPKNLEMRFKPGKAKLPTPLSELLQAPETKPTVEKFISNAMDGFLQEISRNALPLALNIERKTRVQDLKITLATEELVPHIAFHKTPEGVEYRFQLGSEEEQWPIRSREVESLTNTDPAWILVDNTLYRVPGINGNMVRPFRTKDVVNIPADKARVYFRQFVAKNAGRTRIEAQGFDMHSTRELLASRLAPVENILEGAWYLKLMFEYEGAGFAFGERRELFTTVEFSSDGKEDIVLRQVIRDKTAEADKALFLTDRGLKQDGRVFRTKEDATLESVVSWLAENRGPLETAGFSLESPQVEGHSLALLAGRLEVESTANPDWFDIQGSVRIGAWVFPFKSFWQSLRQRQRFFKLPDGTYFLIPESWFTRYAEIADASAEGPEGSLRLPKSLYTLLASAETGAPSNLHDPEMQADDYRVSADLKASLRPYQLAGAKWLAGHYKSGFGACLADDMGLGKTLQTIALLLFAKESKSASQPAPGGGTQFDLFQSYREEIKPLNALVILPASLVFNWQNELARFAPSLFVCAHTGPKRGKDARALSGYDIVLTTYHTARQDLEILGKIAWHVIVLDESQQIKNRSAEVSKVVLNLKADCKISLSGTPIENSLGDLWMQMEFINPATLGSYPDFRDKFQTPIEKRNDPIARERLFKRVRPFFLRRTKEEVAPDLPALTEQLFYTEMTEAQQKLYDRTKSAARNEILALFDDPKTRFQALQALTKLRQLANDPKLLDPEYSGGSGKFDDVLAQWDTVRRAGHKVLFFSSFEKHLQLFRTEFERAGFEYAWLTGDTPMPERARQVLLFQDDSRVQAFFMTVKAGGVGLNLTSADYVFMLDPWWNPAAEDQAIARAHRIGQTKPVTALRFLARGTIEEKIRHLQEHKKKLGQALFETEEAVALTREELENLLQ